MLGMVWCSYEQKVPIFLGLLLEVICPSIYPDCFGLEHIA